MRRIEEIVQDAIEEFCLDFLRAPHLCYTEHGIHALFYSKLLESIPENRRTIRVNGVDIDICVVQKEYSMADAQGESKRAHWDIAVLEEVQKPVEGKWYDFLALNSVVEFGLNEGIEHLSRDVKRLSHSESNVKHGFAVHLHRFSRGVTRRDWVRVHGGVDVQEEIRKSLRRWNGDVTVYYALADMVEGKNTGPLRFCGDAKPILIDD